jgi:hypothetical protein
MKCAPQTQTPYFGPGFEVELSEIKAFGVNCNTGKPGIYRFDIKK